MAELAAESGNGPPLTADTSSKLTHQSPEELVARAIAPVKKEFLRPPPTRPCTTTPLNDAASDCADVDKPANPGSLVKEKKSKRQIKRERRQDQKSVQNVCPEVAKTGEVNSCVYGDKCRYSHDIEAFKSQKPADIEGECPFMVAGVRCRYGLGCRFAGTHKEGVDVAALAELNGLNKNVQKLLWKNKMKFPKADAKLKELGLLNKTNSKVKGLKEEDNESATNTSHVTDANGCCDVVNDSRDELYNSPDMPEDDNTNGELRPQKKVKIDSEEKGDFNGMQSDNNVPQNDVELTGHEAITGDLVHENDRSMKLHPREKKLIDFRDKLYLAPLTTVGNLPFRRVCKMLGADITCGEMAMCTNLLQGQASEWALLRRHSSEDLFGVQICGAYPDTVTRAVELIEQECTVDFIDINMGCPIDIVVNKGAGSALINKPMRIKSIIEAASSTVDIPITVKVRTGYFEGKNRADSLIADIGKWGATAVTVHGRTRQQRYSKLADWDYIYKCAAKAPNSLQVLGNGDVFSYIDWNKHKAECPELSSLMIARGALIKPWLFTEIKEQRHWDISSGERFNILKDYVRVGLEHWGSDNKGVETTRHFLLEWLSYTYRYVPVGLLDVIPQCLNWRPPSYYGRDDLETLMASDSAADWVRISEMLLGKVPEGFTFAPKHKSNAYDRAENG